VILVRQPNVAPPLDPRALAGDWSYYLHAKLAGDPPRRDTGFVSWDAETALTGGPLTTLDGVRAVDGGWHYLNATAHTMSQHVSVAGIDLFQSGIVDPSGRFIVGWTVRAPSAPDVAEPLENRPRYGSMLLMLRPN